MLQEQATLPNGAIIQDRYGEYYLVEALLGQGGSSAVYRVRDRRTREKIYALKEIIDPKPQDRRNLAFEAELLMRLDHRSLPCVYQVFENVKLNRIFMLMDYVEGKNLEMLRQEQPDYRFSLTLALALMTPIIEAVDYLHKQSPPVVHRDIKPANIIVPDDVTDAYLVDFGLAKEYVDNKTTGVFRYGTPGYAAPEQYGQGTNVRTDIYALSATLYTLLTGAIPTDALARSINELDVDPLARADTLCPTIPASVALVIEHGMSLRKEQRFPSVEEFWQELCIAATQQKITAHRAVAVSIPSTPVPIYTHSGRKKAPRKPFSHKQKRILSFVLLLMLIFVILDATFLYTLKSHQPAAISKTHHVSTAIKQVKNVKATLPVLPHTPTVADFCKNVNTPIAPVPSSYPQLRSCYGGSLADISPASVAPQGQPMYLWDISQDQDTIKGNFEWSSQSAPFRGAVKQDHTLTFNVELTGLGETLRFVGKIKYDGELQLDYGTYNQNGQQVADGYGNGLMTPY